MESLDLTTLIVGVVCGIGMIEIIMWLVVIFRHPGFDDLRPDLIHNPTSARPEESITSRTVVP